ncbi:MAG: methyltransferase domain-containing protein, partial [Acidobacteriota bacterium]
MDDPGLEDRAHFEALRGLARLNGLSRTARTFWKELVRLAPSRLDTPVRILDVACGGGDIAVRLSRIARRAGKDVQVDGCDLSARAIAYARQRASAHGATCRFFPLDVRAQPLPIGYDVFISSLFLHHLGADDAVALLADMARASRCGFMIDDLRRTAGGYLLAAAAGRLASRSPVVHRDSLLSVRAAFTIDEAGRLPERAGLTGWTLRKCFPCRFLLTWRKEVGDGPGA